MKKIRFASLSMAFILMLLPFAALTSAANESEKMFDNVKSFDIVAFDTKVDGKGVYVYTNDSDTDKILLTKDYNYIQYDQREQTTMYGFYNFRTECMRNVPPIYINTVIKLLPVYEALNETGVLTFTYDYGRLTLTDGVTTRQSIAEEDEEGVISILKYAQNAIYDVCISYIGRNITSDTQASLEMEISGVLEAMVNVDKSLINIDSEGLSAYEVDVVMNPRATQLVGKIYVYLKITPVHALRQIECEMTVQ